MKNLKGEDVLGREMKNMGREKVIHDPIRAWWSWKPEKIIHDHHSGMVVVNNLLFTTTILEWWS